MASRRSARLSAIAAERGNGLDIKEPPTTPSSTKPRKRKATAAGITEPAMDPPAAPAAAPSTPRRKRVAKPAAGGPPLATEGANGPLPQTPLRPTAVRRLADPRATNAPLLSPETSRLVTSRPREAAAVSPSKRSQPVTTTENILGVACQHLVRIDPRMKPLIDAHHCRVFSAEGLAERIDPFENLASGIISQQVSGAAAKSIKARFISLFDDTTANSGIEEGAEVMGGKRFPHPSQVAVESIERLRTAGLSQRKAEYVQGLAAKFASGELSAQMLADAPYEEVVEKLVAVRGLGRWSVEMFACFGLKRMDVFSVGDLGVQRGMAAFVGRDVKKLKAKGGGKWKYMSEKEMEEISSRFAPYRSVFMWYMWKVEATDVSTME